MTTREAIASKKYTCIDIIKSETVKRKKQVIIPPIVCSIKATKFFKMSLTDVAEQGGFGFYSIQN